MGPGSPAFDFWFPFGKTSLKFILFAAGNDLVQDLLSHPIASFASTRWIQCSFNRMFPGWINAWAPPNRLGAKHLTLVVMSVCWVPGTTSKPRAPSNAPRLSCAPHLLALPCTQATLPTS
jgi:hypothetical protein